MTTNKHSPAHAAQYNRLTVWVFSVLASALIAACSGGGSTDPMATYKTQTLQWQPCNESALGDDAAALAKFGVTMSELRSRVTCASMRAPINYAKPADGELRVALMRVAAEDPQQRIGAILFNPGGPGSDGLFLAPIYAALWSRADQNNETGKLYKQMSQRYDVIGFSPRGTGSSTNLHCQSNEVVKPIVNDTADRSTANIDAMLYNARIKAEACAKNPLTPFINTDATARDMDLIRHLLGDEKLNYYGISYGSWLGTWYAGLFPERVGRMLLTGIVDQTQGNEESFLNIPMGYQQVFDRLIVPYAARHSDIFSVDGSAAQLGTIFENLDVNLQGAVSDVLSPMLRNSSTATKAALAMIAGKKIAALLDANPYMTRAQLLDILASTSIASSVKVEQEISPDGRQLSGKTLDAMAHDLANQIANGYFDRLTPTKETVDLPNAAAMAFTVVSNDMAMKRNVSSWINKTNLNATKYPLAGGMFTEWPGLFWGGPTVQRPSFESINRAGNIVLVQNEFDGVTTLEGAENSLLILSNASFIVIRGEYTHGTLLPYGNSCVDDPVARYFLFGTKPATRTECTGLKLFWDR